MNSAQTACARYHVTGRAFGCGFDVTVPANLAGPLSSGLPVGWQADPGTSQRHWELVPGAKGGWAVLADDDVVAVEPGARAGLRRLLGDVESWTAEHAAGLIAVQGGAVAWRGQVIALPGPARIGTTTLVAALVRAGAGYLSDRFLLLTPDGMVLPYPRPLRLPGTAQSLGARDPLPLALVTCLVHRPGAGWDVRPLSPGHTVLALADSALGVSSRPREVMGHVLAAVPGTTGVTGTRGEADAAARHILGSWTG